LTCNPERLFLARQDLCIAIIGKLIQSSRCSRHHERAFAVALRCQHELLPLVFVVITKEQSD
jgi:hypothetical protein